MDESYLRVHELSESSCVVFFGTLQLVVQLSVIFSVLLEIHGTNFSEVPHPGAFGGCYQGAGDQSRLAAAAEIC